MQASGTQSVVDLGDPAFEFTLPPTWITYDATKGSTDDFMRRLSSANAEAGHDFARRASRLKIADVRVLSVDSAPVHGFASFASVAVLPPSLTLTTVRGVRDELSKTPGTLRVHVQDALVDGHTAIRGDYLLRLKNPDGKAVTMRAATFVLPTTDGRIILVEFGVPRDLPFTVANAIASSMRVPTRA
jgi:hypothetical protein